MNILIIEDDPRIADFLGRGLRAEGHRVELASTGPQGLEAARQAAREVAAGGAPVVLILDLMLPGIGGLEICQTLRAQGAALPILMLSALGAVEDRVAGLRLGADDYLAKPFDLEELMVRVKALLRRSERSPLSSKTSEILSYSCLTLVPERFEAIWFDQPVRLTHLEFELLHCLLQRHGQTVAPSLILKEVWGYEPDDDIETIRVHVRHLRTKLEPDPRKPRFIKTVYGAGYCLELPNGDQISSLEPLIQEARSARARTAAARASQAS